MTVSTNVGTQLALGAQRLRAGASPEISANASLEAGLLLAHALRTTRARLLSHPESAVEPGATRFYQALIERRARGEPLAYLTGEREFWSLPLRVTPAVLVPRPETELLVERALALRSAAHGRVADLGTGSGAVALALASGPTGGYPPPTCRRTRWRWRARTRRNLASATSTSAWAAGARHLRASASISS